MLSSETEWRFCPNKLNAADLGSQTGLMRNAEARDLWINGPSLLQQYAAVPLVENEVQVVARRKNLSALSGIDGIDKLIESAPHLYFLQKRVAYLIAFVDWLQCCKVRKNDFIEQVLNAAYLEKALLIIVKLIQNKVYVDLICSIQEKSANALDKVIKQCDVTASPTHKDRLKELRLLKKYRRC